MRKMYKLLLSWALLSAAACNPAPDDNSGSSSGEPLTLSADSFLFESEGGEKTLEIKSSQKVYIVGNCSWCKVSSSAFAGGKTSSRFTVDPNEDVQSRSFVYSIVCGDEKKSFTIEQKAYEPGPVQDNEALATVRSLGLGWNLGNQLDAINNGVSSETAWGNPLCTQTTFKSLKNKGFGSVRIPVTWSGHIGEAPDYILDQAWLARVAEVAGCAKTAGLKAIINLHHDTGWLDILKLSKGGEAKEQILACYKAVWAQIAECFKNEGDWLIFEAFNELHDGSWGYGSNLSDGGAQYRAINELNQLFVNTVRAAGGENAKRFLGIPGYCTNAELTVKYLELPQDIVEHRLMVAIHYYDPSGYALGQNEAYTEWGHSGASGKKDPYHDEKSVVNTFDMVKRAFLDKNVPVYFGETGCVNRSDTRQRAFQKYWFEYVYKAAADYGVAMFLWDNGAKSTGLESFGYLDHASGDYINNSKEVIDVMKKATFTRDSSYTLDSVYSSAPK